MPSTSGLISTGFKAVVERDSELVTQIKSWFDMKSYGAVKQVDSRSASDGRAIQILEQSTVHEKVRYFVGMLWSSEEAKLPNIFFSAFVQLNSLEKRLSKDSGSRERYAQPIREDLSKKNVVKVQNREESEHQPGREWYLPNHPVMNPKKPGKVRRVLNEFPKFQGVSLNKVLLTGPDLLQKLIHTLHQQQFAVSADIEGMFLQVGILPSDLPALRFLWWEDPSKTVEMYQYTRHIFGAKDSPTCANYASQRTARDHEKEYPDAAEAFHEKFYMDEYQDSMESPDEALKRSRDLVKLLSKGGFKLTKFISNVPGLLEELEDQSVEAVPKVIGASMEESSSHVLGLKWDLTKGTLVVSCGTSGDSSKAVTQRLVLSLVAKVLDPIGLVAPFTVTAQLLKDIWRLHDQSWDNKLHIEMIDWSSSRRSELPTLVLLTIPR